MMDVRLRLSFSFLEDLCGGVDFFGLSWAFPSRTGGSGRGGSVDVLCSAVCRAGLRLEVGAGDFAAGAGGCVPASG